MTAHAWVLALVILSFVESNFSCPPEKSLACWAGRVRHQSQSADIFSVQTVPSGFSLRQQIPVSVHRIQMNTHAWLASETKQRWKTNDGWSTLIQVFYRNIKWQTVSLEHDILLIQKWQNFHAHAIWLTDLITGNRKDFARILQLIICKNFKLIKHDTVKPEVHEVTCIRLSMWW